MVDKYRILDSPGQWRRRNGVSVPDEYLDALRQNNIQIYILIVFICTMAFMAGYCFAVN